MKLMKPASFRWIALMIGLFFLPVLSEAREIPIKVAESKLNFHAKSTFEKVDGRFDEWQGSISFDDKNPLDSSVRVMIRAASIKTGNESRDKHLRGEDFFGTDRFPDITFKSKTISPVEGQPNFYVVTGDLTIRDKTHEVSFPSEITTQLGQIKAHAEITINRKDFGVNYNSFFNRIKDEVTITFAILAE